MLVSVAATRTGGGGGSEVEADFVVAAATFCESVNHCCSSNSCLYASWNNGNNPLNSSLYPRLYFE